MKTETSALPRSVGSRAPSPPPVAEAAAPRPLVSPFSKALGIEVVSFGPAGARLAMRRAGNEGVDGVVDAGALLSLADTCAALACLPSLDERLSGSATLSMSAVFGDPLRSTAVADGHAVAGRGGVRSALIDVGGGALTACISYRFLAADSPA
jgi:acyl-coenzyme A thioesterase PaaI-like protein